MKISPYQLKILKETKSSVLLIVGNHIDMDYVDGKPIRLSSCYKLLADGYLINKALAVPWGCAGFQLSDKGKDYLK